VLEVKRLRQGREWNQTELAYHAGLAPSVISQIENGKRDPSARTLRKLADALEVEVGDLFPKAQAPLPLDVPSGGDGSLTLTFNDIVQDLRRTTARHQGFDQVRQGLNEFCDVWEKRLAEGDFDQAAIDEAGRTINFFWPAVTAAADAEMVEGLRFGSYEEVLAEAKVFPAIQRFQALCDEVNRASREQFRNAASSNVVWLSERKAS
jgi:transcriptional regulator with XRE-family HTH domain